MVTFWANLAAHKNNVQMAEGISDADQLCGALFCSKFIWHLSTCFILN
jgi:hypothetical protein